MPGTRGSARCTSSSNRRARLSYGGAMRPEVSKPPGPLALVGSGEYLPVMAEVEGPLIEGRPSRYVQIPTAAAPEGPRRLQYWLDLAARASASAPYGTTVLGIDEDTALVSRSGDGRRWQVHGRRQAWLLDGGPGRPFPAGATIQI